MNTCNIKSSSNNFSKHGTMLNFISFGSGSNGNCYYLFNNTETLMIDAGVGIRILKKRFFESGLSFSGIHNVIITHDHADHVKCVGCLSKASNIKFYATQKVHKGIEQNFGVKKKIPDEAKKFVTKNEPFDIGGFHITAFEVPHDSIDNVGYLIEYRDFTLCIITDAGHVTDEMKDMISKADYLIIEANHDSGMLLSGLYPESLKSRISGTNGHLSNIDCAKAISENMTSKLKHIWLCHLSGENNSPETALNEITTYLAKNNSDKEHNIDIDVLLRSGMSRVFELE